MKPERFARVKELLLEIADLSAGERAVFLDDACRDDPELRGDVESMLAQEGNAPEILQTRGGVSAPGSDDSETPTEDRALDGAAVPVHRSPGLPSEIAGYRIIRKLGEGGMGVVYEAEQQNPQRAVALKVVRGGAFVDDYHVRLFQREAQSLARLKHAAIAAIYEAGRTDEGQHFFAMELVRGVTLAEHLKERPLPGGSGAVKTEIQARLALFAQICAAVAYAHQRGVIHRDLKPANILVVKDEPSVRGKEGASTGEHRRPGSTVIAAPAIKILDFGLARITDTDVAMTTVVSEIGKIQGTLPYMSPEQARGNPAEIDLRSDVYALGVILYEMLTGQLPYDVDRTLIHEAVRVICQEEPRRPSTVVRTLRGDVETIALKALEKDPEQRYQTAQALADDIERYLADEPILARPPSTTYQLRKLVARHKAPFAFAAAIFVLLVAFGVTMTAMYGAQRREHRRAEQNLARASAEAEKATQINQFLQDMLSSIDPEYAQGREVTVREILDEAAEQIETSLAEQPEVRAAIESTIGNTYRSLGFWGVAEEHQYAALEILRSLPAPDPAELVTTLNELAWTIHKREDYDSMETLVQEASVVAEEHLGRLHPQRARGISLEGDLLCHRRDFEAAEARLREALALTREIYGDEHVEVTGILSDIGLVLTGKGDHDAAEQAFRQALAMTRKIHGARHPQVAIQLGYVGDVLARRGDDVAAEAAYIEVLTLQRELYPEGSPNLAISLRRMGGLYEARGDHVAAGQAYGQALDIDLRLLGEDHPEVQTSRLRLGRLHARFGDYERALDAYLEDLAWVRRRHVGQDHLDVAISLTRLGYLCQIMGDGGDAEGRFREALAIREKLMKSDHPRMAATLTGLGGTLVDLGRADEADSLLRRALEIREAHFPPDHDRHFLVAVTRSDLGAALAARGRYDEAETLLLDAQEILRASAAPASRKRRCLNHLVDLYEAWGKPDQAAQYREQKP